VSTDGVLLKTGVGLQIVEARAVRWRGWAWALPIHRHERISRAKLMSNRVMTKSSPYIRLPILNKNGLLMAQFSRYQFIPLAKLFTQYISRPFLFKIYLAIKLLDIIGYLSGLCLSTPARRDSANQASIFFLTGNVSELLYSQGVRVNCISQHRNKDIFDCACCNTNK
jgi:hypothetical protein